ncbi:MAG: hypothetical protein KDC05_12955 [Bacteroidales bacterium]|nr:hypothetical protein [Bacteroidales bacterium]
MKRFFTIAVILLLAAYYMQISAQGIGIGEWRDHLPYHFVKSVASADDKVFAATPYSLFYYNKGDHTLNRLSRVNGLNDQGISTIAYNNNNNSLVVAYSNTNIDLIKGNSIINMPDILNSVAITPEERMINGIDFLDNLAYLSCGFGIVVIDLAREEVVETYYIGPQGSHINVMDVTFTDTRIYAATESGIYNADRNNPNLAFFEAWSKDLSIPYPNVMYNHIVAFSDMLITNRYSTQWGNDTIYYLQNGVWNPGHEIFGTNDLYSMYPYEGDLYLGFGPYLKAYDGTLTEVKSFYSYYQNGQSYSCDINQIDVDHDGIWVGDSRYGLVWNKGYQAFEFLHPNGPVDTDVFAMSAEGNSIWAVPGGRDLSWNSVWKGARVSYMVNGQWGSITPKSDGAEPLGSVADLVSIAVNPLNKSQVFAGSWSLGIVEFDNYRYDTLITPENSSLGYRILEGPPICKVGGLAFDENGNLWASNSGAENILSVRRNDGSALGEWTSFYFGNQGSSEIVVGPIVIDPYGQKWIMRTGASLIVFDDAGTIEDKSDDQVKFLSAAEGNGDIPGTKVYSIAADKDGEIWIGTDEGVAVFYAPENVFSNQNFDAQQILIPRNDGTGLADILLEFESITAIAVDGANKKWIGTERSGVYHFSSDGLEEIYHFTMDNSPLLSNNVTSIAIDDESGEVFFGTASGIISFKGSATEGGETNINVFAYPNPVRPGYDGPIAVRGLVNNASFRITDMNGSLIYSGRAEGGQAIWDGNNFNGRRAQSGVYLVFVTDDTGDETMVTKILFMN